MYMVRVKLDMLIIYIELLMLVNALNHCTKIISVEKISFLNDKIEPINRDCKSEKIKIKIIVDCH